MSKEQTITIDDKEYHRADLSQEANTQIENIQITNQEVNRLIIQKNITKTARAVYANALSSMLPSKQAAANKKKDVITIDGKRYNLDDFSDDAKRHLASFNQTERKLEMLEIEIAIAQTAKNAYVKLLSNQLQ